MAVAQLGSHGHSSAPGVFRLNLALLDGALQTLFALSAEGRLEAQLLPYVIGSFYQHVSLP